jgi:hypothetical protein
MVVVDSWTCRHVLAKGRYQGRQEEDRQWFLSFHGCDALEPAATKSLVVEVFPQKNQ